RRTGTPSCRREPVSTERPFAGVTVVEFGHFIAVPWAGQVLADGGAHVIKIEPLEGEPSRHIAPLGGGESRHFLIRNRGKHALPIADYMAAALLAFGVASALYRRERTGRGGRVDTSLLLAALALQNNLMVRVEALDGPRHAAFREWLTRARAGGVPFAEQVERMP